MWRVAVAALSLILASPVTGQYATAPNGYYPSGYHGQTFTGNVVAANDSMITLNYTKGKKAQTFVGTYQQPCAVTRNGRIDRLKPSDLPKDAPVTVFFMPETKKLADGEKAQENVVFGIKLKGMSFSCMAPQQLQFTAF